MRYLLGADMGTTSLKMVLFDEHGTEIKSFSKDYQLEVSGDYVEFDAEKYWEMLFEGLAELSCEHEIYAMSIDTQCETLIVADSDGHPLRKVIVWLDNRAGEQARGIERDFGSQKIYEITGQAEITAAWPACKLLWLKENEPEIFNKTRKVFLLEDYLLYRLTGSYVTEKTLQSSSLYLDIRTGVWWKEMLDYIGIDEDILPKLRGSGEVIGKNIVTGVMDQIAGAVGAGVVREGIVSEMTGTAMVVFAVSDKIPLYSSLSKIPCHVNYDGKYCLLSWTPTAGMALKWFKDNFCEAFGFSDLDKLAAKVPPGSGGLTFLPYLCGSLMPKYNPDAKGVFYRFTMEHTRAHAVRSILESVACMLKSSLDYLGVSCNEIRSMGGGAASPLWCQIKADLAGERLVTLKNTETACLGSAIIAGVGTGVYPSVEAACERLVKTGETYRPQGIDYSDTYKRFCGLEDKLV